jgi:hypothetical protein
MNKHPFRFLSLAAAVVIALATAASADTLAEWSLNNTLDGVSENADALTAGSIMAGPSVGGLSLSKNGYVGNGWAGATLNSNAYYQFTVTASADYSLKLSDLTVTFGGSKTGPTQCEIQHSLNGTKWIKDANPVLSTNKETHHTIDCSAITVPSGQTVTIRIYAWAASGGSGTFRIGCGDPLILSGTAVGTKQPPTIAFPNEAEAVAVSNKLTVNITVLPDGSGIKTWSFLPKPSGTYYLQTATKRFTFTPAMADEGSVFTLSVTATNSYGTTTAELPVTVTEFMPPGSWFTGFETGVDPYYPKSPTDIAIDERMWTIQQLAFLSSNTIPKVGARACVFGSYSEAYMVSDDKLLDASHGFGTVSFQYAAYPGETAACQPLIFEIATDLAQGNWIEFGRVNPNGKDTLEREEFVLNTTEPVYMRIRTEYVNNSGRVVLDQLAVTPCELPERTAFETYLLKYNVTPGDPGSAESDDFDEDGYSNLAEFNANPQTNPYDRTSHP